MIKPLYRKFFTIVLIVVVLLFIVLQFIPSSFSHSNPPVTGEPKWDSPSTRETFFKACADCHSNETRYPWYSKIAPVSFQIESDVKGGRKHFNISTWDQSVRGGEDATSEVHKGSMPKGLYLLLHPEANLNAAEKKTFIEGLMKTFGTGENTEE